MDFNPDNLKGLPIFKISDIVNDIGVKWGCDDYYISADSIFYEPVNVKPYIPDFYGLIVGIEGWVDFKINDELIRIQKNTFFAIGSNIIFQRSGHSNDCKIRIVLFTKSFLANCFNNYFFIESFHHFSTHFKNCVVLDDDAVKKIEDLYSVLLVRRHEGNTRLHIEVIKNLITSYVFEFAIIVGKTEEHLPTAYTREAELILSFKKLVFENCLKEREIVFYANKLCMSSKHLIKVVKSSTGHTPGYFINEALIWMAKTQIENGFHSISEIARLFPFSDLQTFSKFFKRHVGMSPLQYKYRNQK